MQQIARVIRQTGKTSAFRQMFNLEIIKDGLSKHGINIRKFFKMSKRRRKLLALKEFDGALIIALVTEKVI